MHQLTTRSNLPEVAHDQQDYFLLDGSGSMEGPKWWKALEAIDAYIAQLKANNVQTYIRIVVFATNELDCIARECSIDDWVPCLAAPFGAPFTGTPLYDAITVMGIRLRDDNPKNAGITIATDGDENDSDFTDLDQAASILRWMRAKGWQVNFIGADFNNQTQAEKLGMQMENTVGVRMEKLVDMGRSLGEKRAKHARWGTPIEFSEDERQEFGGYLTNS